MSQRNSYGADEFLASFEDHEDYDGLARNLVLGYFRWDSGALYFSPSLGPCPFIELPKETRIIPDQTYNCPFPFGNEQMWSGQVELPDPAATKAFLEEIGFDMG